jgi:hypothetical protein
VIEQCTFWFTLFLNGHPFSCRASAFSAISHPSKSIGQWCTLEWLNQTTNRSRPTHQSPSPLPARFPLPLCRISTLRPEQSRNDLISSLVYNTLPTNPLSFILTLTNINMVVAFNTTSHHSSIMTALPEKASGFVTFPYIRPVITKPDGSYAALTTPAPQRATASTAALSAPGSASRAHSSALTRSAAPRSCRATS